MLVSMVIGLTVIGVLALMFATSNDSALSSQRDFTAFSVLQSQIEKIRQAVDQNGFSALALTSAPAAAPDPTLPSNPTSPDDFITGSSCNETWSVMSNYNLTSEAWPAGTSFAAEPVLVNGCTISGNAISGGQITPVQYADLSTGTVASSTAGFPAGDSYATIYAFVTQTAAVGCNAALGSCTGDDRRVVLAALLNQVGTEHSGNYPIYSTTVFANPVSSNQPGSTSHLCLFRC